VGVSEIEMVQNRPSNPSCVLIVSKVSYLQLPRVLAGAGELYVALVTSSKANARLVKVDPTAALAMRGVVGFIDHTSVPGSNLITDMKNEEVFATSQVHDEPVHTPYRWSRCTKSLLRQRIVNFDDVNVLQ